MVISGFFPLLNYRRQSTTPGHKPLKFGDMMMPSVGAPASPGMGQLILSSYELETLKKKFSSGGIESKYPIGALMDMYRLKQANPTQPSFSINDLLSVSLSPSNSEWSIRALGRALHALTAMRQPLVTSYIEGQFQLTPRGRQLAETIKQKTPPEQQSSLLSDTGILYALDNLVNAQVINVQDNFTYM